MRTPFSCAFCTSNWLTIRCCSTCFSSTFCGGSLPPELVICWVTVPMVWLSWLCRITPSFTTAMIRSRGWTWFELSALGDSSEDGCALVGGGGFGLNNCADAGRSKAAAASVRTRLARKDDFIFVCVTDKGGSEGRLRGKLGLDNAGCRKVDLVEDRSSCCKKSGRGRAPARCRGIACPADRPAPWTAA